MKEKILLNIALVCSVTGLIVLFFISDNLSAGNVNLNEVSGMDEGKDVKITGKVERLSGNEKVLFLEIGQEKIETVSVLLFKGADTALKEGDYVEIEGEITESNGEKEVIANKVRII
jgi:DNA/RNA endonuclease YhcR with UshA esterase domain